MSSFISQHAALKNWSEILAPPMDSQRATGAKLINQQPGHNLYKSDIPSIPQMPSTYNKQAISSDTREEPKYPNIWD